MRRIFWIIVFSISMAFVESAVVIYLRDLHYPEGFAFPLKMVMSATAKRHVIVEVGREVATILVLMSVASLSGKRFWERFSYFLICFGIWDIFYYLWLRVAVGWPSSILDWDVLFLIPWPWIGPIIAPVSISVLMILAGFLIIYLYQRGYDFHPSPLTWVLGVAATLIILYSFLRDTGSSLYQQMPLPYRYDALIAGEILYLLAIFFAWRNTVRTRS